ncbi:MAG: TetR family transcriptional regulator [Frondihabitans sp.]|nr:TetR family transcriptional regulator [Frondihabitans sp.]
MSIPSARAPRRTDALSRDRIIQAAIELLDDEADNPLTVRALTAHLATGRGAIYHHVSTMDELVAAAADDIISHATTTRPDGQDPEEGIRLLALGIFDAIDAHPWVGAQLAREPMQPAVLRIWKGVGLLLRQLGVTGPGVSDAGSALVSYVLGSAAQFAAGARRAGSEEDRLTALEALAAQWSEIDPDPIVREASSVMLEHDDRQQFLAGVDIFLVGITAAL